MAELHRLYIYIGVILTIYSSLWLQPIPKIFVKMDHLIPQIGVKIKNIYTTTTYLEPKWPLFWLEFGPSFGGLKPQNRGQTGSTYLLSAPSLAVTGSVHRSILAPGSVFGLQRFAVGFHRKKTLSILLMVEIRLTSWYGKNLIIYKVLNNGAGFFPSTVLW